MKRAEKSSSESGESSISQETIRKSLESFCEEVSGEDDKKEKLVGVDVIEDQHSNPIPFSVLLHRRPQAVGNVSFPRSHLYYYMNELTSADRSSTR